MSARGRYLVKELFGPTIQGEGFHAGRACVFLRFAVCNLACRWCDTDFAPEGAVRMNAGDIVARLRELDEHGARMVVVTGGEPALQWDGDLSDALRSGGFEVHMETNGTRLLEAPVDWLTVSPKPQFHSGAAARETLVPKLRANECKVVVDETVVDDMLAEYERHYDASVWSLQPCMDKRYDEHLTRTLSLIKRRPRWRLSLQVHKIVGLP